MLNELLTEQEAGYCKTVLEQAYGKVIKRRVSEWLDLWKERKGELAKLLGGKLRVTCDIETDEGEESEDGEDEAILRVIKRIPTHFDEFRVTYSDKDMDGRAIQALHQLSKHHALHQRSSDWLITQTCTVFSRDVGKVITNTVYTLCVGAMMIGIVRDMEYENVKNNRMPSGMKINKYVKTMLPSKYHQEFDDRWSMVIQSIKPIKSRNDVIISIAPIDYLLQSEAGSWGSCHALKHERGTAGLSMAADSITLVAYRNKSTNLPAETHHELRPGIEYPDKSWRQLIHVDLRNGGIVFGREYPSSSSDVAEAVRKKMNYMLAEYKGVAPLWKKRRSRGNLECHRIPYPDLRYDDWGVRTLLKGIEGQREPTGEYGDEVPCLSCGAMDVREDRPFCGDCRYEDNYDYACVNCGYGMDEDDRMSIDPRTGEVYCPECYNERFSRCDCCGELEVCEDMRLVEERSGGEFVCESCYVNNYYECEECNETVQETHNVYTYVGGEEWCSECVQDKAFECAVCGELHHEEMMQVPEWVKGEWIDEYHCEDCRKEIIDDMKDEEAI